MRTRIIVGFVLLLAMAVLAAASISIQLKGSYFLPSEQYFKSIYGNAPTFGAKIDLSVLKSLGVWLDAEIYSRTGATTLTSEKTELQLIPIAAGLRYLFLSDAKISPYLGAGIGYFHYKEASSIGTVSKGDIGFVGQAGFIFRLGRTIFIDAQGNYSSCKVNPAGIEAQLGGLKIGLGAGAAF